MALSCKHFARIASKYNTLQYNDSLMRPKDRDACLESIDSFNESLGFRKCGGWCGMFASLDRRYWEDYTRRIIEYAQEHFHTLSDITDYPWFIRVIRAQSFAEGYGEDWFKRPILGDGAQCPVCTLHGCWYYNRKAMDAFHAMSEVIAARALTTKALQERYQQCKVCHRPRSREVVDWKNHARCRAYLSCSGWPYKAWNVIANEENGILREWMRAWRANDAGGGQCPSCMYDCWDRARKEEQEQSEQAS